MGPADPERADAGIVRVVCALQNQTGAIGVANGFFENVAAVEDLRWGRVATETVDRVHRIAVRTV